MSVKHKIIDMPVKLIDFFWGGGLVIVQKKNISKWDFNQIL